MNNIFAVLLLSTVMGFSIFLTFPLFAVKRVKSDNVRILSSVAVGIIVFLIADVFTDSAALMYNSSLAGYGTNPVYDAVFLASVMIGFLALFFAEGFNGSRDSPYMLSFFIALGIGFQNLTEGLVFGSAFNAIGLVGTTLVVLVGFILQNLTEGFPIISPFVGRDNNRMLLVTLLFLVGGFPTIIGGGVGYFYSSTFLNLLFDGLAIGAMLYVILPILRGLMKTGDRTEMSKVFAGVFVGFVLGFLVNLI